MANNRGSVWARAEILLLLNIWRDEDVEGQLQGMHRNLPIYNRVSELLEVRGGFKRTPEQCRNKLKSLKSDWSKAKTNFGRSGTSGRNNVNNEEFVILNDVLSARPIHSPVNIVDTMVPSGSAAARADITDNPSGPVGQDPYQDDHHSDVAEEDLFETFDDSGSRNMEDSCGGTGSEGKKKGTKRVWTGRLYDDEESFISSEGDDRPSSSMSSSSSSDGKKSKKTVVGSNTTKKVGGSQSKAKSLSGGSGIMNMAASNVPVNGMYYFLGSEHASNEYCEIFKTTTELFK
ncbi:myb/SANT-like DNA-binding domain-containing protein 7 [Lineus longissimus]|uniref:myb/SANT-like DNA-binding domain-containing protein 7 n=1 Tax=Lineus longissimus TaxID=88925 RepID=UPI00315D6D15